MSGADDEILSRAVVIVGAPRSGTTMLGRILSRHPAVAYLNEPRLVWRYGNDSKSDRLLPADARPGVRRHIRTTFAERVRGMGKGRLLEKTPSNALRMGFVDSVLPDCRFVHIIRDGRESALGIRHFWTNYSTGLQTVDLGKRLREVRLRQLPRYAKEAARRLVPRRLSFLVRPNVWGPRIPGIEGLLRDLDLLEVCCLQWRMCVEAACHYGRKLPAHRYLEVRLEDMSPALVSRVLEFCELPEEEALHEYLRGHFDPGKPGARTAAADADELELIRAWTEPTLRWLGYA